MASFIGNRAGGAGGGIDSRTGSEPGDVSFTDSTISGNRAGTRGGGLYNQQSLEVSGTRITGNWAVDGGRIYANGTEAMVTLHRLNLAALTLRVRVPWQVTST